MAGNSDMESVSKSADASKLVQHASARIVPCCGASVSTFNRDLRLFCFFLLTLLIASGGSPARAQTYSPVVISPPVVDAVDGNHVSILSGKTQFSVPALELGDVSFAPFTYDGDYFTHAGLQDNNYGQVLPCAAGNGGVSMPQCTTWNGGYGVEASWGQEQTIFIYAGAGLPYQSETEDGSSFTDNGSTCTWIQRDGTQIVYEAYRQSGSPLCLSNNILSVTYPDGRILTYYYYGSFSTTQGVQTPIISIASNTGYLLKYNYSGTPQFSMETSVTAINRSYESCDPTAVSCSLQYSWPTATLTWQQKTVSPCDNFLSIGPGYDSCQHQIFTIQDAAQRNYVFELDSYARVISYQPPEATSPVFYYGICSPMADHTINCGSGSIGTWPGNPCCFDETPLIFDLVATVTRNGQKWSYRWGFTAGGGAPPSHSEWQHSVTNPLGLTMSAAGNATPGTEIYEGPTDHITTYDGTYNRYDRSIENHLDQLTTPAGVNKYYSWARSDVGQIKTYAVGSSSNPITESATYPEAGNTVCIDAATCNKPTSVVDANGNETDYTYDAYGNVLTQTDPAAPNGIRPEILRSYVQRHAWYLNSSGAMTEDPNPIWLLSTETICKTGAVSGSGCANPNDAIVTTYDYGPDSGPNNLLLRGKTVTGDGQTLGTCYGHDKQGNKIWETSPNANPASCPAY